MKKLALVLAIITLIFSFSGCSTTKYFRANYYQPTAETLVEMAGNIQNEYYRVKTDGTTLKGTYAEGYSNGNVQTWEKNFKITKQSLTGKLTQTITSGGKTEVIQYDYVTADGAITQTKTTTDDTATKSIALRDRQSLLNISSRLYGWYKEIIIGLSNLTVPRDCIYVDDTNLKLKINVTRDLMLFLEPDLSVSECGGDVYIVFDYNYNVTCAMLCFNVIFEEKPTSIKPTTLPNIRMVVAEMYLLPL